MRFHSLTLAFLLLAASCTTPSKETAETPVDSTSEIMSIDSPTGMGAQLPHLVKGGDGYLYLSWVVESDGLATMQYARLTGEQWSPPETIASGDNWFVNWADYPTMTVDNEGSMIAHYPAKSGKGTYAYDVNVVLKPSGSSSWSPPVLAHTDGTHTEHGFVSMLPQNNGTFLLTWLDGRFTGGVSHDEGDHGGGGGAMTVRSAVMDLEGNLSEEAELDNRVCDCCQTGVTLTPSGAVAVYRDRSDVEIRDMYFSKKTAGEWSVPQRIAADNWNIAGCPVNGPRIASHGDAVTVAWFTAANGEPKVKIAFSADGQSFGEPILVDGVKPLGRVDVVMLDASTAVVSWLDNEGGSAIKYRQVTSAGEMTAPVTMAETSESRGSGFPQMELVGDQLYFAWTVVQGEESRIEMARVEL